MMALTLTSDALLGRLEAQTWITLLEYTNSWQYVTNGANLGTEWRGTNYDDSVSPWISGRGLFGYEDELPSYVSYASRAPFYSEFAAFTPGIITYYFRTHFTFPGNTYSVTLVASNLIDDGAVFYLNGMEVGRVRVPGDQTAATSAQSPPLMEGQDDVVVFSPAAPLRQGDNVLAVELHQYLATSRDVVWGAKLIAVIPDPIIITTQPENVAVPMGSPLTLSVRVTGSFPNYRWYRNNIPLALANATNATYFLPNATTNAAGNYYVVVSNLLNVVTSRVAAVTVVPDNVPPRLLDAVVADSGPSNIITLSFNEPILGQSVTNLASYRLEVLPTGQTVAVSNVQLAFLTNVALRVGGPNWRPDGSVDYLLTVNGLADTRTNVIAYPDNQITVSFWKAVVPWNQFWVFQQGKFIEGCVCFDDSYPRSIYQEWKAQDYTNDTSQFGWVEGVGVLADRPNVNLCAGASLETQITPWAWTTFFRGSFFIPADRLASGKARLSHVIDDGALFYLNGREISRFNMPGGTITFDTQPPAPMNASCRGPLILQVTNLVGRGANVLAVEVHDSFLSPDVAMGAKLDLLLTPLLPTRPTLSISAEARSGSTLDCRISWRPTNRFWLEGATHLSSNPPWTLLSTNAPPYVFSVDSASEATIPRFFRVRSPD